jgi:alpha-L-rhamnosidase
MEELFPARNFFAAIDVWRLAEGRARTLKLEEGGKAAVDVVIGLVNVIPFTPACSDDPPVPWRPRLITATPFMKFNLLAWAVVVLFVGSNAFTLRADLQPLDQASDPVGESLQQQMIWASPDAKLQSAFVAFRKQFNMAGASTRAELSIFADVRYMLWINGQYVLRGPARFNPKGPEYDGEDVKPYLKAGDNEIVVLVMANQSNGKMMHHAPGLTVRLDVTGAQGTQTVLTTDETWKWSDQTRYRDPHVDWGNEMDVIDSTVEDGDWTQPDYNDSAWANAVKIDGAQWGPLSARRIPLLKETPLEVRLNDQDYPLTLSAGQQASFTLDRLVQAYTVIDFEADADTSFELPYAGISYKAKAGRQVYISTDTHGFKDGAIKVTSGKITIYSFKPVERLYPFDCVGSFTSSDPLLNKLWSVCARSLQVMSEDAYVDCADRERTEWMDCSPPDFDVTRTAMAGPGENGAKIYADPRLLEEMLRRTALTLQPDGWVKAHTCSDRFDIHAKMEDRACDWVEGARLYYESTGDPAPIREIWPAIVAQMNYFLDRRSSRGLVIGREWVIWGNPMGYQTCEGAGLNAFVYKALADAAFLGSAIGKTDDAEKFNQAAQDLAAAFNKVLWDEQDGTYYSGFYTDPSELPPGTHNPKLNLSVDQNLVAATVFPALFALDQGIVPAERQAKVAKYLLSQPDPNARIMFYYYYWKQLYAANQPDFDKRILDAMRTKWKGMANWPWQTTWEEFSGGSQAHCYGMFPGYFLSAYVLGVRLDGPAAGKHVLIEPHLGDLASAEGTVVSEFGPVPVSWTMSSDHLDFEFTVPDGVTASLRLPSFDGRASLLLDNHPVTLKTSVEVKAGVHKGTLTFPAGSITFTSPPRGKNFTDDFTRGSAAWQEGSGAWKVDSGSYTQTDASAAAVTGIKALSWSDATYEFTCQITHSDDSSGWAGFGFRKAAPDSKHDDGGYLVYLRENGDIELFAGKVLASVKAGLDASKPVKFKVVATGDRIQVYLNDGSSPRIDVRDDTSSDGFAGFETSGVQASFGPLSVRIGI